MTPPESLSPERMVWEFRAEVGRRIAAARQRAGLSQAALARQTKISQPTISRLETGHAPTDAQLIRTIAIALNVPAEDLVPTTFFGDRSKTHEEGMRVYEFSRSAGLTPDRLSELSGIPVTRLSEVLAGDGPELDEKERDGLSRALNISPDAFDAWALPGVIVPEKKAAPTDALPPGLAGYLQRFAKERKIKKREVFYLSNSRFKFEPWVEPSDDFWDGQLRFWREFLMKQDDAVSEG